MEGILYYDKIIDERCIYFGEEHENQITKELDTITLDVPILLVDDNYDGPENYYALEVTQRTLDFLKEHRDWDFSYELYFNYRFEEKPFDTIDIHNMEDNSTLLNFTYITEEDFEERELKEWAEMAEWEKNPENQQKVDGFLGIIADFHNKKWHDGEEFWKVNEDRKIVHKTE